MRRLTTDPLGDVSPRWSPDGRYIAFKRCQPVAADESRGPGDVGCQLRLISAMGGTDSKISDVRFAAGQFDWSPDGRFIVAGISQPVARQQPAGLYLLPVAGGTPRRLTTPKVVTAQAPAFSRDGRRLAYASCIAAVNSACDVYVLDLDTAFTPVGQARRLTSQGAAIFGLTWSRNGQSIIYDAQAVPGLTYLWSVDVAGHDQPVRIEVAGVRASEPATTSAMDRLVFSRSFLNFDVYRDGVGPPATTCRGIVIRRFSGALLARRPPDCLLFKSVWRVVGALDSIGRWLGRSATHSRHRSWRVRGNLVATWPTDRIRLYRRGRAVSHLAHRSRRWNTAAGHRGSRQSTGAFLVSRWAMDLLLASTVRP